ncbi:hypothetical protein SY88_17790 [Clostridiales bacterium PH28_bin88]|nr:hypothetical protein SY88_17790 [Clostridiales bacterium PH28_bin88]
MRRSTIAVFLRKRVIRFLLIIGLIGFGLVAVTADYTVVPLLGGLVRTTRVILDAGHGGIDPGAHDRCGVLEKNITLDVVLRMGDYLALHGVPVEFTRESDRDVTGEEIPGKGRHRRDLEGRLKIINRGTVGVSVHVNSSGDSDEHGAVVFYPKDSEEGKRLAEAILQKVHKVQSLNHTYVVPRTNLYLLRASNVPTVLVEMGFISNPEDKRKLQEPAFRQQMAVAVSEGILQYLEDKR